MAEAKLTAVVSTKGVEKANRELKGLTKNSKNVETNVIRAEKRFKSFGKNAAAAIAAVDGPLGGISSRVSALTTVLSSGTAAMTLFAAGFVAAGAIIIQGVANLDEFEVNLKRVNATIRATGAGVGFTGEALRDEAELIALATLTSVDAVQKAQAKLLTFNRVLGDEFSRSIRLSQDLAEAGFGSIESNAILLGKALQDPIKGMAALSRVGVTLSQTQKDMAEDAIAMGDIFAAQGIILDAVAGQVKGVAEAVASGTLAGAVDTLGQNWDELTRKVAENSGALTVWTQIVNGAAITAKNISDALAGPTSDELFATSLDLAMRLASAENTLEGIINKNTLGYAKQRRAVEELKIAHGEALAATVAATKKEDEQSAARLKAYNGEQAARKKIAEDVKLESDKAKEEENKRVAEKEQRDKDRDDRKLEMIKKQNQREIDLAKRKEDKIASDKATREKQIASDRRKVGEDTVDNLGTLLGKENALFKAAAITNTTIKTYESATSAYAAMASIPVVGPALGAAAAGVAVAAGLVNVSKIASARAQGGHLNAGQSTTFAEKGELEILTPSSSSSVKTASQMRSIMGNDSNGGGNNVSIVVIDQSTGAKDFDQSIDDDGKIILMIRDTVALDIANSNSNISKSLEASTMTERRR